MIPQFNKNKYWASGEGVYIPSADEHKAIMQMQTEVDRAKQYLN